MTKVLIVDDHKIVRDGIAALISSEQNISLVGQCTDGSEVVEFLKHHDTEVILMDIMMPNMNGIEATKLAMKEFPDLKILCLSMNNEYNYIQEMLNAGAAGYILKNTGADDLLTAIKTVAEGKHYFSPEVTDIVINKHISGNKPDAKAEENAKLLQSLTNREIEVLKLIAQEMTNVEIADKLFISRRTVDTHRQNLLQKIGTKNSIGLVRFAYSNGLIED
jgi:DNA-binding NarL/FixJ family response regulator